MRPSTCHPDRKHHARGLCYQCYTAQWQQQNRDKIRTYDRERYQQNLQQQRARSRTLYASNPRLRLYRRSWALQRKYGITEEDYQRLYAQQNGRCPICLHQFAKLFVDHNHDTGVIRGLLCIGCNRSIGQLGDTQEGLERALAYLQSTLVLNTP